MHRGPESLTKAFQTLAHPSEEQKCWTHAHAGLEEQRAWSQCRKHLLARNPTKPRAWHNFQHGNLRKELKNPRWTPRSLHHSHCLVGTGLVWTTGCEPSVSSISPAFPAERTQNRNTNWGTHRRHFLKWLPCLSPLKYYMFAPAKAAYPVSLKILLRTIFSTQWDMHRLASI